MGEKSINEDGLREKIVDHRISVYNTTKKLQRDTQQNIKVTAMTE